MKSFDYSEYSDEELILLLRDGEESIMEFILEKYKFHVRKKAETMFILGADKDDLIQEGMIGLFKAVKDYDSGRDASFYTFADLCILRQIYKAIQASNRKKHMPLNSYISLYGTTFDQNEEEKGPQPLANILPSQKERNPEEVLIDQENVKQLETMIDRQLSMFEKQVLDLYITGMKYTNIAKVLGKDEKATDNALQRIKMKIRTQLLKRNE